MYVAINDIQNGHALLLIVVIMASGFSMKWLLEVSRMKKWFTPNDLVLASFYKTSPQVFTFLETCNPYEFMNLANFSLSKMTYRCSDDFLFWASPLTCETRSWEFVLNLSLSPHLNGQCDVDDKRFILSLIISDRKPYTEILRSSSQLHFLGWTQLNFHDCWIPIYKYDPCMSWIQYAWEKLFLSKHSWLVVKPNLDISMDHFVNRQTRSDRWNTDFRDKLVWTTMAWARK